jgi:predicted DNA-binding protein with PD1-like motif
MEGEMRYFTGGKVERVIIASLTPGDLFLESIEEIIKKEKIETGVVTSCIGSFRKFRYHTITWTGMPPKDRYFEVQGPIEIGGIQGLIVSGEPHLHVTFNNCETGETSTGHIEHGCETCYLIELFIEVIGGVSIKKNKDPDNPGVVAFVSK